MVENKHSGTEFSLKNYFVPFTTVKAIHFIVIIALIVFANSLFNSFSFDDDAQILKNLSIHSFTGIPGILLNTIHAVQINDYYRPVPAIVYTIIYHFFQQNSFFYHLIQVLFHTANAILILLLFKKYLNLKIAFFLSLLFLIHPINEETVVYIANLQDVLFVFFGLAGLFILQSNTEKTSNIVLTLFFFVLSLLAKESGILFFSIAFVYLYLYRKTKLGFYTILSLLIGIVYGLLRLLVNASLQKDALVPIMTLSFEDRLLQIPGILRYYIQTFLFPKDLVFIHTRVIHEINFSDFYLPLLLDCLFFSILLVMIYFVYKRTHKAKLIIFSLCWFLLGLLLHFQFFPLDFTVADRFFYFPSIGLFFFIGLFLQSIHLKGSMRIFCISLGVTILLILSARTMMRNTNWINQSTLLTHDEKLSQNDYAQELLYGEDLFKQNRIDEAYRHVKESLNLYPKSWIGWDTLGVMYYRNGNINAAKKAYLHSMAIDDKYYATYEHMAILLYNHGSHLKARDLTRKATAYFPYSEQLWFYRALTEYETGSYDNALMAAKNYYALKQDQKSYELYSLIQAKQPLPLGK